MCIQYDSCNKRRASYRYLCSTQLPGSKVFSQGDNDDPVTTYSSCALIGFLVKLHVLTLLFKPPSMDLTSQPAQLSETESRGSVYVLYSVYAVYCIARLYTVVLYSDRPVVQGASAV